MATYIELDKQGGFPPSSNVGKLILGVSTNSELQLTNSNGNTFTIGGVPYLEYTSIISKLDDNAPTTDVVLANTLNLNPIWLENNNNTYSFKIDKGVDVSRAISYTHSIDGLNMYSFTNQFGQPSSFSYGFDKDVRAIAIQSDGKILVGGDFDTYNGSSRNKIIRLNTDRSVDASFGISTGFGGGVVHTIAIQSDGKILVGGSFTDYNGTSSNRIIRLNGDGTIDGTFNIGGGFNGTVRTIAIQTDSKILVGGAFTDYNGNTTNYIIRLNTDGGVDHTFISGTGFNASPLSIVVQTDGKILVGGAFTDYNGDTTNYIIRLNSNGSIDTSFDTGGGFDDVIYTMTIQGDGKILAGGDFTDYNGSSYNSIIRLNTDGSIDGTFSIGTGFNRAPFSIVVQSDGKILVGGSFGGYDGNAINRIIRLNSNGSIDSSFFGDFDGNVFSIALQSDGKILVGGAFGIVSGFEKSNFIAMLNIDGTNNNLVGYGFDATVHAIAIQTDGKILVGGSFTNYKSVSANRIMRLNTDGSIDTTFGIGTGFDDSVYAIDIQSDGKILVGGAFTEYDGNIHYYLVRLNGDGTIDGTFNIGSGFDSEVRSIAIQADGKILVGGSFNDYNGGIANYIIRLNSNGGVDHTFISGTGFNASPLSIVVQTDGKILVGGAFTDYNGDTTNYIIRLNSNGSIDTSFDTGNGFDNGVRAIAIQSDGKILVGGDFGVYDTNVVNRIIRLNINGLMDGTFNIGTGFDDSVYAIDIQSDGKILVGGAFTEYDGNIHYYLVRLNTNGSTNYSFSDYFQNVVFSILIQPDKDVLVGGDFKNDIYSSNFRKLYYDNYYNLIKERRELINQPIEIKIYK